MSKNTTSKKSTVAKDSTVSAPVSPEVKSLVEQVGGNVAIPAPSAAKSAKTHIRELLAVEGAEYTLQELCDKSGKTAVNIATMLSDLRSPKYCGKAGVFNTKSTKKDGKTYYSKA